MAEPGMAEPGMAEPGMAEPGMAEIVAWRRKLHRMPELSGEEGASAREVFAFLAPTWPDRVVTGPGGHGVAAVYEGA